MTYDQWQARWPQAAAELRDMMARQHHAPEPTANGGESYVQSAVRLEGARAGVMLWRNNVGALLDSRGVPVRYGLANDNAQVNAAIKSADLIGIRRIVVGPEHVGRTIGQFVSRECKHAAWRPGEGGQREAAQQRWAQLVASWGGDAAIVAGPGSFNV